MQADDSRRGGGWGKAGRLLAPFPSANLLPVAKFVSNGFLINNWGKWIFGSLHKTLASLPSPARPPRLLSDYRSAAVGFRLAC